MSSTVKRNFPIGKPILEIDSISLSFGGVKAITNTSFNVLQHEIRAIIGPNGAGKSSLLNCINGIYKPQEGTIKFRGKILDKITPNTVAQNGVSRTFQNLALFKRMSAIDNIMVGRKLHTKSNFMEVAFQLPRANKEEKINRDKCEEIVSFLEIEDIKNTPVGKLPYGLQKRVELGRALATEAEVLLLDEPMAGMNVEEKREMCRFILETNDQYGTTIVLIEHDMGVVMDISDRVVVLDYGKIIGEAEVLLLDEPMAGMNVEEKREMCRFILETNDQYGTTIVLIEHDMGVVMDISDRVVVLDYGKIIGDGAPEEVRSSKAVIDAYLGVA